MRVTGFSTQTCVMEFATLISEYCACEQNVEWWYYQACFLGFQIKGRGVFWGNKCQVCVYLNFFVDC